MAPIGAATTKRNHALVHKILTYAQWTSAYRVERESKAQRIGIHLNIPVGVRVTVAK